MATSSDTVSVERIIPAAPEKIFDLLADPARHQEIDGSGTVRNAKAGSERLALGSKLGMSMKMGIPYSMSNEVIDFEENRRIAWQTRPPGSLMSRFGGRIWRYELEPVDGGTRVRETWDISQETGRLVLRHIAGAQTRKDMEKSLERLDHLATAGSEAPGP